MKVVLLMVPVMLFAACGEDDDDKKSIKDDQRSTAFLKEISGKWVSEECEKDLKDDSSSKSTMTFLGDRVILDSTTFLKEDCQGERLLTYRVDTKLDPNKVNARVDGAKAFVVSDAKVRVAIYDKKVTKMLSKNSECGISDWKPGKFQAISPTAGCELASGAALITDKFDGDDIGFELKLSKSNKNLLYLYDGGYESAEEIYKRQK